MQDIENELYLLSSDRVEATSKIIDLISRFQLAMQQGEKPSKNVITAFKPIHSLVREVMKKMKKARKQKRGERRKARHAADAKLKTNCGIRKLRASLAQNSVKLLENTGHPLLQRDGLNSARHCYICKKITSEIHSFYDAMCISCGDFNFMKRKQTANLQDRICLVTGGRIKIGYQIVLKLLQAGASVITTSRFPKDLWTRFSKEVEFPSFSQRLQVYGLDCKNVLAVESFAQLLLAKLPYLDILINNAAQTIRRPPIFYQHLLQAETKEETVPNVITFDTAVKDLVSVEPAQQMTLDCNNHSLLHQSALSTQQVFLEEDKKGFYGPEMFPEGRYDADGQQLDLRPDNTWTKKLTDISTVEMLETLVVNAATPFVLCSKLAPLLTVNRENRKTHGYIINVSAMEGVFNAMKKATHPHNNMSKAALNMLTRTCGMDYAQHKVFVNAVDPGWVSDNYSNDSSENKSSNFHPPIDTEDGAARVLDPIFTDINAFPESSATTPPFGLLFKDYHKNDF